MSTATSTSTSIAYLTAATAADIDKELMGDLQYSVEQLMELAGLSVAQAIYDEYPPAQHSNVLLIIGPGNNGGDGLVAARHLKLCGYSDVQLCYPKQPNKPLYQNLLHQCTTMGINCTTDFPADEVKRFNLIVDAIFGFSFDPANGIRKPFDTIVQQQLPSIRKQHPDTKVISIDIPSGWHVEQGDTQNLGYVPHMNVSLTLPKQCMEGRSDIVHYLGGRFLWPEFAQKHGVRVPTYQGNKQYVKLSDGSAQSQQQQKGNL